jgi:hypothetical protein
MDQQVDLLVSVVSLAELEFGVQRAPLAHRPALANRLAETRRRFGFSTKNLLNQYWFDGSNCLPT